MLALTQSVQAIVRDYNQFKTWYPRFGFIFDSILHQNCTREYDIYLYGTESNVSTPWDAGGGEYSRYTLPVIQCLIENSSEFTKASLSVSQLVLGLAPTLLTLAGASSLEMSLLAVIGKRPLLTTILAIGSPAIHMSRAFDAYEPSEVLAAERASRYRQNWDTSASRLRRYGGRSVVAFQYVLAAAAAANVSIVNWELGTQAINMLTPSFIYYPLVWTFIGLAVHLVGAGILHIRARRLPASEWSLRHHSIKRYFALEFTLLGKQENGGPVCIQWADESVLFLAASWFHSLLCLVHLVFGTIVFSGVMFIAPEDAFFILVRYAASCLICRVILVFEVAGLREAYNRPNTC
ncbi:uncharacterized protein B0H64DRAFT_330185 [Chaetomium fimeti]|uniref:Uncharacterized protein n=1 Tax=Chaetomium fimeti TaxID=1854472 RepID=A0AAE0H9Q9_9PEZI|nr:hypothetical protein B0H64DRAFT_330185 [Chaetomium fimeti]